MGNNGETVSETISQIKAYDGLLKDLEDRILVIITKDNDTRFDNMLFKQGISVFHMPPT
jgi:hypothetical protein